MTPAEFHFVSRLTDVVTNLTLRNATGNATMETLMVADASELKMPFFWIQLGLLPVPPILACYLFTKVADYIGGNITRFRQPHHELTHTEDPTIHPALTTDSSSGQHTPSTVEDEEYSDDMESFRFWNDQKDTALMPGGGRRVRPIRRSSTAAPNPRQRRITRTQGNLRVENLPAGAASVHGTYESSRIAGANAKDKLVIGNKSARKSVDGGSLTRVRVADREREI